MAAAQRQLLWGLVKHVITASTRGLMAERCVIAALPQRTTQTTLVAL